jgi:predicted RNA-binding Zn-ribbon protein involved in translation (DUF1610 family)
MSHRIRFYCWSCNSKLRASIQFVGQSCTCPECGEEIVVPSAAWDEESPALVMDDGHRTAPSWFCR